MKTNSVTAAQDCVQCSGSARLGIGTLARFEAKGKSDKLPVMLFLVMERFKGGNSKLIGERFRKSGRMLPEGVVYHASWVDSAGTRCFQLMEAAHPQLLDGWVAFWKDLIDFEIVPVLTSGDFWSKTQP